MCISDAFRHIAHKLILSEISEMKIQSMNDIEARALAERFQIKPSIWYALSLIQRAKLSFIYQLVVTHFCRKFDPDTGAAIRRRILDHLQT